MSPFSAASSGPALRNACPLVAGGRALGTPREAATARAPPAAPPAARRTAKGEETLAWGPARTARYPKCQGPGARALACGWTGPAPPDYTALITQSGEGTAHVDYRPGQKPFSQTLGCPAGLQNLLGTKYLEPGKPF